MGMQEVYEKVWGTTEPLLRTPLFELHRLTIKPWVRCSMHMHHFKHNAFYVIEGELFIDMDSERGTHQLLAGTTFTIYPNILHQFRTGVKPCLALEMYFVESLGEDIERLDVGCAVPPLPEGITQKDLDEATEMPPLGDSRRLAGYREEFALPVGVPGADDPGGGE